VVCPHCLTSYHPAISRFELNADGEFYWRVAWQMCPACTKFVISLGRYHRHNLSALVGSSVVHPKAAARKPFPKDVIPPKIAEDYNEACLVLADSPKASAALSRRCLQNLLREHAKVKPQNLNKEIDDVLNSKQLPSHLAGDIDAIRQVGNFAAHPTKDTSIGEIVDVEPGEAEWLLDLLEGLFDFYFVEPGETQKRRDALNAKLTAAGKPPLKQD
jgi:hypothetical protein